METAAVNDMARNLRAALAATLTAGTVGIAACSAIGAPNQIACSFDKGTRSVTWNGKVDEHSWIPTWDLHMKFSGDYVHVYRASKGKKGTAQLLKTKLSPEFAEFRYGLFLDDEEEQKFTVLVDRRANTVRMQNFWVNGPFVNNTTTSGTCERTDQH